MWLYNVVSLREEMINRRRAMNTEKQAIKIIDAYTQMNQTLWNSWADIMQGWNETLGHAASVWGDAFRTATQSQLALTEQVGKQVAENIQSAAAHEKKAA